MPGSKSPAILLTAPQPFFQERGTPIAVRLMSETLASLGYRVHLLVFHEGEEIEIEGVEIHRSMNLPFISNIPPGLSIKKLVCDLFVLLKMISLHRRHSYDLIHSVEESVFLAQFLKIFTRKPYVYDMDSCMSEQITDKHRYLKPFARLLEAFEKRAITGSKGVIAVCQALENTARNYHPGVPIVRLEDVSMIDSERQGDENLRERYRIDGPLLLYVGNLESYQGIDLLLDGFALASQQVPEASLLCIGGSDTDIEKYRHKVSTLGLAGKVIFCGTRPFELLGYYLAQADILVSPRSQGSNTPMKIYSYLGSGSAILATRLPTHTQVLNDQVACLVDPTADQVASGIITLCRDASLRERLGENGRALAEKEYSVAAFRRKLADFYDKIFSILHD